MIIRKIFSPAASIISLFIFILFLSSNSISDENNIKHYSGDEGILSLMYHRFNENKYPSTNIQMDVFKEQIEIIKNSDYSFSNPKNFVENFTSPKTNKEILITIDDGFLSFYLEAWPFLKQNKEVGAEEFVVIGHHSHSHGYLIDKDNNFFISDIEKANEIFLKNLGYIPNLFSYPFGEYSKFMRDYISQNFDFAFGQHSGVIDLNKDRFELPRFPINENYGKLKRFSSIINSFPLEYEQLLPLEKKLSIENNPPNFQVKFFNEQTNLNNINCYSNELDIWERSKTTLKNNTLTINFRGPFVPRRGRINCSLNDKGKWRWFGVQFPIKKD